MEKKKIAKAKAIEREKTEHLEQRRVVRAFWTDPNNLEGTLISQGNL